MTDTRWPQASQRETCPYRLVPVPPPCGWVQSRSVSTRMCTSRRVGAGYPRSPMDERVLCERLITYDTSTAEGIQSAGGFVKGGLEARDIGVETALNNGLPVLAAPVGPEKGPPIVPPGPLDGVPAEPGQFEPRVEGD